MFRCAASVSLCCFALSVMSANFLSAEETTLKTEQLAKFALTQAGDPEKGKELFRSEEVTKCLICHKVGSEGGAIGPDLTMIGGKFDRPHLIESLLEPSRQIVEGYRTSSLVMSDGRILNGIVKPKSETEVTLLTVEGKSRDILREEIDQQQVSDVSLMPEGLAQHLSSEQFADLIAYLETLRPEGRGKPGESIHGPIRVADGYEVETILTGLDGATALEVLPDGRILICEQTGKVRVVENGKLLPEPFVTLPVDSSWERGVIGVTVDPEFPKVPYVYVCWVAADPYPHHRVSRFEADGNVAIASSEKVLLVGDNQNEMGGKVPNGHQGGALHFGPDGDLFIGIGEQTAGEPAQHLDTFLGKILRINKDGSIPADNPLLDQTSGKYQAIWASGARNPFTFAFRKSDGLMLINDVGGKFEEVNRGVKGVNYGWPTVDHGPQPSDSQYAGPVHWYPQASISGGDFAPKEFSSKWEGDYFFADFVHGWIKRLNPDQPDQVSDFAAGLRRPVDLRFGDDGSLYVLLRNAWVIDNKFAGGTGSLVRFRPKSVDDSQASKTSGVQLDSDAKDSSAADLPAFQVTTPRATYFLEKTGAGLSSLLDRDGNDWLGFHPAAKSGAAGEYRGFPNAVYKEGGNFFHALNQATDPSSTGVVEQSERKVVVEAVSGNGEWAALYEFFPKHFTWTMTKMPADRHYWVLYEGTPGGEFDENDWWMSSDQSSPQVMSVNHEGDLPSPEWMAFGDHQLDRALLIVHHEDDDHADRFYQMQNKMTVFGFGRQGIDRLIDSVPQSFSLTFVDQPNAEKLSSRALELIEFHNSTRDKNTQPDSND
ncbi:PQQ-dependent sugar dehydrogenase [Thalassoglobus sp. JC818]|uniref:PQQ-dependent sugar dehydrogenase n=1 Tax=Thalassoglobus sp. JC818 TaxID=3232136 RepID=UPI00345A9F27